MAPQHIIVFSQQSQPAPPADGSSLSAPPQRTVDRHGQTICADMACILDMVDRVGQHRQNQVAGRYRAKALECYVDGDGNNVTAAQTRDDTANHAHTHKVIPFFNDIYP